jgi:hypothetical protein
MNMLFGIVAMVSVGCMVGFLVALHKEQRSTRRRNLTVHVARTQRNLQSAARGGETFKLIRGAGQGIAQARSVPPKDQGLRRTTFAASGLRNDGLRRGSA